MTRTAAPASADRARAPPHQLSMSSGWAANATSERVPAGNSTAVVSGTRRMRSVYRGGPFPALTGARYSFGMGALQPIHLIVIMVIVLVIFGAGRIGEVGSALGKGVRDFRTNVEKEPTPSAKEPTPSAATRFCPQCGAGRADGDARFCAKCGGPLPV